MPKKITIAPKVKIKPPPKKPSKASKKVIEPKESEIIPPPPLPPPVRPRSPSPAPVDLPDIADIFGDDFHIACLEDSGAKRRRLGRRDTEDSASRAIEERLLKFYSKATIEGATNKKGSRIHDVVSEQIRSNRSEKKNLTSRFWDSVICDFGLKACCVTDQLPDPEGDDLSVSTDVLEKLGSAHCDNPAQRSTEPLERFLDHCADLSYAELKGIMCASMESQKIVRAASTRMLMAALTYIARICAGCTRSYAELRSFVLVYLGCCCGVLGGVVWVLLGCLFLRFGVCVGVLWGCLGCFSSFILIDV